MPSSPTGALAAALAVWLGVVAISENNLTLLGVAAIGAAGSISAAVIAAGTRSRIERLERKSEESK